MEKALDYVKIDELSVGLENVRKSLVLTMEQMWDEAYCTGNPDKVDSLSACIFVSRLPLYFATLGLIVDKIDGLTKELSSE